MTPGQDRPEDRYATMLCEAMRWVYACPVENENRKALIRRFEALELTPAISPDAIGETRADSATSPHNQTL